MTAATTYCGLSGGQDADEQRRGPDLLLTSAVPVLPAIGTWSNGNPAERLRGRPLSRGTPSRPVRIAPRAAGSRCVHRDRRAAPDRARRSGCRSRRICEASRGVSRLPPLANVGVATRELERRHEQVALSHCEVDVVARKPDRVLGLHARIWAGSLLNVLLARLVGDPSCRLTVEADAGRLTEAERARGRPGSRCPLRFAAVEVAPEVARRSRRSRRRSTR